MIGTFTGRPSRIIQFLHTNLRLCHWRLKIILIRGSLPSKNKQTTPTLFTNLFNKYSNKQTPLLILIYLQSSYFLLQYCAKLRLKIGGKFSFLVRVLFEVLVYDHTNHTLYVQQKYTIFPFALQNKCTRYKVFTM